MARFKKKEMLSQKILLPSFTDLAFIETSHPAGKKQQDTLATSFIRRINQPLSRAVRIYTLSFCRESNDSSLRVAFPTENRGLVAQQKQQFARKSRGRLVGAKRSVARCSRSC